MIHIAIVDDHTLFREGLVALLKRNKMIHISVIASNGKEFLKKLKNNVVNIILLDLKMTEMDGYATCMEVNELYPDIKVVILTSYIYPYTIKRMLELKISGYYSKSVSIIELQNGILEISKGAFCCEQKMIEDIQKILEMENKEVYPVKFSKKELQIIRLTLKQLSNIEIAQMLEISKKTVESHKYNMMQKVKARNFLGVIKYAFKHDYLYIKEIKY